jgi:hypothetical protein
MKKTNVQKQSMTALSKFGINIKSADHCLNFANK